MGHETTLILDDETRSAARELARRHSCSTSEAIRRAVIEKRDREVGIPVAGREKRVRALEHLFELFEAHDAETEIRRLKAEDRGF